MSDVTTTAPRQLRNFVAGEYVDAQTDARMDVVDPSTARVVAAAPASSAEDVDRAYAAALGSGYLWHEFGDVCLLLPRRSASPER